MVAATNKRQNENKEQVRDLILIRLVKLLKLIMWRHCRSVDHLFIIYMYVTIPAKMGVSIMKRQFLEEIVRSILFENI